MRDFTAYIHDALSPLGPVTARRMFGGIGLYLEGVMFAMIVKDALYLCADEGMRAAFGADGVGPFRYTAKGRAVTVARFHEAPGRLLDDTDELLRWARHAVKAAAIPAKTARKARRDLKRPSPARA